MPESLPQIQAAAELLDTGGEGPRLARALGFEPTDVREAKIVSPGPEEPVSREALREAIEARHPHGAGSLEAALTALDRSGPIPAAARHISLTWDLKKERLTRTANAIRAVSVAAARSATITPLKRTLQIDPDPSGRPANGIVVPSSHGLIEVLGRAKAASRHGDAAGIISSAILLRACLPYWSEPAVDTLLRGIGVPISSALHSPQTEVAEEGRWVVKLDASGDIFALSEVAFRSLALAFVFCEARPQAISITDFVLGMLAVDESRLGALGRRSLGPGVNLPLAYLRLAGNRVPPPTAAVAVEFGERAADAVYPASDLPPRDLIALGLGLPDDDTSFDSASRARHASRGITLPAVSAEEGTDRLRQFVAVGHVGSLRTYLCSNLPARNRAAARRLVDAAFEPDEVAGLLEELVPGRPEPGTLTALTMEEADPILRLGASLEVLSVQDGHAGDLRAALKLAFSPFVEARAAAERDEARLAVAWTLLSARAQVRVHQASQSLGGARSGALPILVGPDAGKVDGTLFTLLLGQEHSVITESGPTERSFTRSLPEGAITRWWRSYRGASLEGADTLAHLRELAQLSGLTELDIDPDDDGPIRLAVGGPFTGLPLGQALVSVLDRRDRPVITHLAGGPFYERIVGARAPGGLLAGHLAVVSPPPLVGAAELPAAEAEAAGIAEIHQSAYVPKGRQLSRSGVLRRMRLRRPEHRPLAWHFATHGTITGSATGEPTAGVVLRDYETLDVDEIGRYTAPTILICSACDVGALPPSARAPSWPFAAIAAGTQTVIAACKPINDHIAAATMLTTHHLWKERDIPLWNALTQAQNRMDNMEDPLVDAVLERHVPEPLRRKIRATRLRKTAEPRLGDHWAFMTYAP
ncbi:MAG TPA: CHAT domain-containing protein [Solirubrobacterales bacterium]|jgi:hypothetical protein|nr:CHAT domain-containing protein [Solirubrobacterales bacterium]